MNDTMNDDSPTMREYICRVFTTASVYQTVYVEAESEEEARELAEDLAFEFGDWEFDTVNMIEDIDTEEA